MVQLTDDAAATLRHLLSQLGRATTGAQLAGGVVIDDPAAWASSVRERASWLLKHADRPRSHVRTVALIDEIRSATDATWGPESSGLAAALTAFTRQRRKGSVRPLPVKTTAPTAVSLW